MSTQKLRLFCAIIIVVMAIVEPASAQSSLSRDEMDALKAQINALQQEVRELRGKVNKAEQTAQKAQAGQKSYAAAPGAPKAPPTPPSTAVAKMSPAFRPSICSVDGGRTWVKAPVGETENCIALTSRLHFDVGGYDYRPNSLATVRRECAARPPMMRLCQERLCTDRGAQCPTPCVDFYVRIAISY